MDSERLLSRLADRETGAEYELDLTGLDRPHAEESVRRMLERNRFTPARTIRIRLDPPPEGGGQTHFQPIGRMLLAARRDGLIAGLTPLSPETGLGYWIETVGKPEAGSDAG